MTKPLENQVAVVTGAGRGIGRAIALTLASAGARIVAISRTESSARAVADAITETHGGNPLWFALDVADSTAVAQLCKQLTADLPTIDILVNNAGVTRDNLLMRMTEEEWDTVLNTNLKGAFHMTHGLHRQMIRQRSGRIINISSVIGLIGNAGQSNYAASKAGLIGFTKSIARELASRQITVNAIAPGFIETDMTGVLPDEIKKKVLERIPMSNFGNVEDIAAAALFLAGPGARYITGQVLTVDGGMVM